MLGAVANAAIRRPRGTLASCAAARSSPSLFAGAASRVPQRRGFTAGGPIVPPSPPPTAAAAAAPKAPSSATTKAIPNPRADAKSFPLVRYFLLSSGISGFVLSYLLQKDAGLDRNVKHSMPVLHSALEPFRFVLRSAGVGGGEGERAAPAARPPLNSVRPIDETRGEDQDMKQVGAVELSGREDAIQHGAPAAEEGGAEGISGLASREPSSPSSEQGMATEIAADLQTSEVEDSAVLMVEEDSSRHEQQLLQGGDEPDVAAIEDILAKAAGAAPSASTHAEVGVDTHTLASFSHEHPSPVALASPQSTTTTTSSAPSLPATSKVDPLPATHLAMLKARYDLESEEQLQEIQRLFVSDLDSLDEAALRSRVVGLVKEFAEKRRWEAMRLHQSLRQMEMDAAEHYLAEMAKQRAELELALERTLRAREDEIRRDMTRIIDDLREAQEFRIQDALRNQDHSLRAAFDRERQAAEVAVREDAERGFQLDLARAKQAHLDRLVELQRDIDGTRTQLNAYYSAIQSVISRKQQSRRVHEESAAILALETALGTSQPVRNEVTVLRAATSPDSIIALLVDSLPQELYSTGVPTLAELRVRFSVAKQEVRKAALAPQSAPYLVGQIIGNALAAVSWEAQGNVQGDSTEAVLARASYLLDEGKLMQALAEVSVIEGYPRSLLKDWEAAAQSRAAVDQTLGLLKAASSLRHLELQ